LVNEINDFEDEMINEFGKIDDEEEKEASASNSIVKNVPFKDPRGNNSPFNNNNNSNVDNSGSSGLDNARINANLGLN
jgi:hypothetical protein